ncbi:MAG: protein TolQ [Gammaproteobacteria bacterium]|nr:protein TolQ [Gammaproteobacteria bacterium]
MKVDLSFIHLFLGASFLVQLVMLLLLLASIVSWAYIFRKSRELGRAGENATRFESRFWAGGSIADMYRQLTARPSRYHGQAGIFVAGYGEYLKLRERLGAANEAVVDGTRRAMRVALNREIDRLEKNLPFLASVGSVSPYVGLFGTVWGIMNSFRALGNVNQATLAMVAPGIAEALIATAMGLFAAIPAVVAYNRYTTEVERLINRYDNFLEEVAVALQREAV